MAFADLVHGEGVQAVSAWYGDVDEEVVPVELTFRFLDPAAETAALARAGLDRTARLDRAPQPGVEQASQRSYLVRRPDGKG